MAKKINKDNSGETTIEAVVEAPAETAKQKAVNTVYVGRSIHGLSQYTVFKNGVLPPHIEEMAKNNDTIKGLIVPVSELQEARKNINVKGHILNFYANKQKTK